VLVAILIKTAMLQLLRLGEASIFLFVAENTSKRYSPGHFLLI